MVCFVRLVIYHMGHDKVDDRNYDIHGVRLVDGDHQAFPKERPRLAVKEMVFG